MKKMEQITLNGYIDGDNSRFIKSTKEIIYDIIDNRAYKDSKYKTEFLPISNEMDKIKYVIGMEPQLQAWSNSATNVIGINLFTMAVFSNLSLFKEVFKFLDSSNSIGLDRLKEFFEMASRSSEDTVNKLLNFTICLNNTLSENLLMDTRCFGTQ